jgi:hypothetical protein
MYIKRLGIAVAVNMAKVGAGVTPVFRPENKTTR